MIFVSAKLNRNDKTWSEVEQDKPIHGTWILFIYLFITVDLKLSVPFAKLGPSFCMCMIKAKIGM